MIQSAQTGEGRNTVEIHLAAIHFNGGLPRPIPRAEAQFTRVLGLSLEQFLNRRLWQFPDVVGAHRIRRTGRRRTVEQQDGPLDLMQFDQIPALGPHLLRAREVATRRRERTATTRRVEPVVADDIQLLRQEVIRDLLKPAVGTGDDEDFRPIDSPTVVMHPVRAHRVAWRDITGGRTGRPGIRASIARLPSVTLRRLAGVLGLGIAAMAIILAGVTLNASQQTGTIISAVVEVTPTSAKVLSATAVRGTLPAFDVDRLRSAPRGPNHLLLEYVMTTGAGQPPRYTGAVHVPLVPIIEELSSMPPQPKPPPTYKRRVVLIALPDVNTQSTVTFSRLVPDAKIPPAQWQRVYIEASPLPVVRR